MPERHVTFAGEIPAAVQTAHAATAARRRYDPADDFSGPSEPIRYPRCRYCGRRMIGACPMPDCAAKAVDARYARFDHEAEETMLGPCERSQHGGLTLVVPQVQAWGRIGE